MSVWPCTTTRGTSLLRSWASSGTSREERWESISGVNITLGLPIIRSSVDHGTAFGKAGKGTASELSLVHAVEYAVKMALQ